MRIAILLLAAAALSQATPPQARPQAERADPDIRRPLAWLLEAQNVSLAILRQQRRDEGEWPRVLAKRLMLLERELRDGKQDIGRMPRHISRHRPLG